MGVLDALVDVIAIKTMTAMVCDNKKQSKPGKRKQKRKTKN